MSKIDLNYTWPAIRKHFSSSFKTNLHVSIASTDSANGVTVTPIGSFFLNEDFSGFYFEKYPSKLPKAATNYDSICILGVDSRRWFWLKSLFMVGFSRPPAIKLYGKLGALRKASPSELHALKKRMRWTRALRGHQYLWANMAFVREVTISHAESINLGKMTGQHER